MNLQVRIRFIFHFNDIFVFKFLKKLTFAVYRIWTCWSWNCYRFEDFSHILILLVWISFHELVIPSGIIFLDWISCPWGGNSRRNLYLSRGRRVLAVRRQNSSGGFLIYELVIPGGITIYPVESECCQSANEILPVDSSSMAGNSRQNYYLSRGGRVLAVRGRKILRMVKSPGFLTMKDLYLLRKFF
jgi:hypothetical protein